MHQPIHKGDIGTGFMPQVKYREVCQINLSGIGNDQFSSPLADSLADAHADHRVILGGICTYHEECLGIISDIIN